jgi:hypothetical protein
MIPDITDFIDIPEEYRYPKDNGKWNLGQAYSFKNKTQCYRYAQSLVASKSDGEQFTDSESFFLVLLLMARHPEWKEVTGGHQIIEFVASHKDKYYGNKNHVLLKLDDGTESHLSWGKCAVGRFAADRHAQSALRIAVSAQAYTYRHHRKKTGRFCCEISGIDLSDGTPCEVHHAGKQFAQIRDEWLALEGITVEEIPLTDPASGPRQFKDAEMLTRWQKFHRRESNLQLLCKVEHDKITKRQLQKDS